MTLEEHRNEINRIDNAIVDLINERTEHVIEIGKIKQEKGGPVYRPEREKEIYDRLEASGEGKPFPTEALRAVFGEIISASRQIEAPLHIAYLGPEATFTHASAIAQFGSSAEFVPLKSISDVFKEVEVGKYPYGVVPIENSNEGAVNYTLDKFITSSLKICSENYVTIHHNLLSHLDDLSQIKKVYSHPQAFAQCRLWLMNNLPNVELVETTSTAEASRVVAWDKYSAAIASTIAAKKYNLSMLATNIEDNPENYTRFLIISENDCEPSGDDKTSLILSVKDKPGVLQQVLSQFSSRSINLNKIESRPSKKKAWEYLFYVDVDGHRKDPALVETLAALEEITTLVKVLGSYPKMKVFAKP